MNIAVIFAGGTGIRMKSRGMPKQFLEVNGKAIINYTIEHFENHPDIDAIVVVCLSDYIDYLRKLTDRAGIQKVCAIVAGGNTAIQSQYFGLKAVANQFGLQERHIVLLHDAVRPLINEQTITNCIASVKKYGSAITISPAIETIIKVDENENVLTTIKRKDCRLGRAPQCFWLDEILAVHERAILDGIRDNPELFIDSATMMQYYNYTLHVVEGPAENIKITTPTDYYLFRALLNARDNSKIFGID